VVLPSPFRATWETEVHRKEVVMATRAAVEEEATHHTTNSSLIRRRQPASSQTVVAVTIKAMAVVAEVSKAHTRTRPAWHHERQHTPMPTLALPRWVKCIWSPECNTKDIRRWVPNK